jgi:hypothetical protein
MSARHKTNHNESVEHNGMEMCVSVLGQIDNLLIEMCAVKIFLKSPTLL